MQLLSLETDGELQCISELMNSAKFAKNMHFFIPLTLKVSMALDWKETILLLAPTTKLATISLGAQQIPLHFKQIFSGAQRSRVLPVSQAQKKTVFQSN